MYNNANEQAGPINKGGGFQGVAVGGKQTERHEEVDPDTGSVSVLYMCCVGGFFFFLKRPYDKLIVLIPSKSQLAKLKKCPRQKLVKGFSSPVSL